MRGAPYIAIAVLALIWGYNWVAIKVATDGADPLLVAAVRSFAATSCLFGALVVTRRTLRPPPLLSTLMLGVLQTTLFSLFQVLAVATGGAGKTAILAYTMPFWVVLLAWPMLHERVTRNGWIALAFAAGGLTLVLSPLDVVRGLVSETFALTGAIVWALSAVYGKRLRARYPTDLLVLTTWQMAYGTIPLVLVAVLTPHRPIVFGPAFVAAIAYVALPGTALAWLLWMFILSRLDAGVAGIASLLTPVIGVFAAWLQLGERPTVPEIGGLGLIVVALVVNVIAPSSHARPVATAERARIR